MKAGGDILIIATPCPRLGRRGQVDLDVGVGQHHGPNVASFNHDAAGSPGQGALQVDKSGADGGNRRHRGHRLGDLVATDFRRNILAVKVTAILIGVEAHRQLGVGRDCSYAVLVGEVDSGAQHSERDDAVHRTGIQVAGPQCMRQSP